MASNQQDATSRTPRWARAAVDDAAFAREQARLATLWNFVGFAGDIAADNAWFRTVLGGRSIFVQRFGDEIRAFENRCAHRFYPLRTEDSGVGPVVCGFHHWRYNREGRAVGIPECKAMYDGAIPRDLDARLRPLDVAVCGDMIFARFPTERAGESLGDFLGEAWPVVEKLGTPRRRPLRFEQTIESYWKFCHHISLDDYHIVAVHPTTFGRKGYLRPDLVRYERFGRSSVYARSINPAAFHDMAAACANGSYVPVDYTILNFFPTTLMSQFLTVELFGRRHWFMVVTRYVALARTRTSVQVWLYPCPFEAPAGPLAHAVAPLVDAVLPRIVGRYTRRVMNEDNAICEGQQAVAHQIEDEQRLAAHERRIGWYEEEYAHVLDEPPAVPAAFQGRG